MKTQELTGHLLDYWVAKAEGSKDAAIEDWGQECGFCISSHDAYERVPFSPSKSWSRGGQLIEKYRIELIPGWKADCPGGFGNGGTALEAVCRAVVQATFGSEVDDLTDHPA